MQKPTYLQQDEEHCFDLKHQLPQLYEMRGFHNVTGRMCLQSLNAVEQELDKPWSTSKNQVCPFLVG